MRADLPELDTILRVYGDSDKKLPRVQVPLSKFKGQRVPEHYVGPTGVDVTLKGGGATCKGRIVGYAAIIELKPETEEEEGPIPGQEELV